MQPSSHVEAVLLLTKLNVELHIEVDVNMEELDATAAESQATYNEIREHVWEHHQLKVSNLYIAQVKQKYGIIERENYHKAKNENAKQPQCPKEKEDAIVEALKHFQMIWFTVCPSDFQAGIFFCRNMVFLLLSWYNRCKNHFQEKHPAIQFIGHPLL